MSTAERPKDDELLTPGEVARMFAVTPKTIGRWDDAGILPALRTPGGHRRFSARAVQALAEELQVVGEL